MNLDDLSRMKKIDAQNILAEIDGLPDQLQGAWELGQKQPLPEWRNIRHVIINGMGGSAIGADLLAGYAAPLCPVPVVVHRDYSLPAWARGEETLVVTSSHSGDTEETLDAFDAAHASGCRIIAIATGGELAKRAQAAGTPLWTFEHKGQPRAAVGFSFGLLLALFGRLGLLPDPSKELVEAVRAMKKQQKTLGASTLAPQNPAKREAGQLMGRWVVVMGADHLAPVARRWKGQINELAKAGAGFEVLPEADHNALAGTLNPSDLLMPHTMTLFLRAPSDHPRNRLRSDLTRQAFMLEGMNTDCFDAQGDTRLAHIWTLLHLGDYISYYLAIAYGVDPTPVLALENFKAALKEAK
jgi:glucose/mannose-6-phosphate isomerase